MKIESNQLKLTICLISCIGLQQNAFASHPMQQLGVQDDQVQRATHPVQAPLIHHTDFLHAHSHSSLQLGIASEQVKIKEKVSSYPLLGP